MDTKSATLDDLMPSGWSGGDFEDFAASASYSAPMDCVVYLTEDLSYRADRVDQFLTILWHPHEDRAIGVKIKGIRFLIESLAELLSGIPGVTVADESFLPLVGALRVAMNVQLGAVMTAAAEQQRSAEKLKLTQSYEDARKIVGSATFDVRQLGQHRQ